MISNSSQKWEVGSVVNVGFLGGLTVMAKIPTPGDYAPDAYLLRSAKGAEYEFVPHRGIARLRRGSRAR